MKEWVIPYLESHGCKYENTILKKIKEINFNCIKKNTEYRPKCLRCAEALQAYLNCTFVPGSIDSEINEEFSIVFGSVLGDLPKKEFDKLIDEKNTFYVYGRNKYAYVNIIRLTQDLNLKLNICEEVNVVVFNHHKLKKLPMRAKRGIIAHELAHVLYARNGLPPDEYLATEKAKEWGFEEEIKLANELTKKDK